MAEESNYKIEVKSLDKRICEKINEFKNVKKSNIAFIKFYLIFHLDSN